MATAPPPQRQSVLSERSTTGLTLLDLLEMTPDEIEAHLRATAPQPEPAILRPAVPEAQSAGLIGAELRPMNQPRDVLGEAMAEGSPPVPWVAGYAMLAGRPEDEALMWDTAAGHLGQAMTAHVALPYREFDQTISGETPLTRRRTIPAPEGDLTLGSRRPRRSVAEAAARAAQAEAELVGENLGEAVGPTLRSLLVPAEGEAVGAPIYSQARKIVEDPRTQATQTGEAWLRFLTDPKRGVKAEEMQYTRLGDFLKERSGQRVTRDEILGHLDANEIGVQEVTKGYQALRGEEAERVEKRREVFAKYEAELRRLNRDATDPNFTITDQRAARRERDALEAKRDEEAAQFGEGPISSTKFSEYTLPGAENYREVLLTLPPDKKSGYYWLTEPTTVEPNPGPGGGWLIRDSNGKPHSVRYNATAEGALEQSRRSGATQVAEEGRPADEPVRERNPDFRSGHWDEPNVLAHLRLSDRTDADGKRVLLVEELQSDWGQKGRREGFGVLDPAKWTAQSEGKNGAGQELWTVRNEHGAEVESGVVARSAEDALNNVRWTQQRANRQGVAGVPEAPFVTDTAKWTTLGLKRVLKMAADEGYDRIGIVRGEEQAARYDLSKQIDELKWYKDGDKYRVTAMKGGRPVVQKGGLNENALAETVGKDLADKIVAGAAEEQHGAFSGLDLKVGGEGMKGYYDKIVPEALNKLAKEHGVKVQIEGTEIPTGLLSDPRKLRASLPADADIDARPWATVAGNKVTGRYATREEASKALDRGAGDHLTNLLEKPSGTPIHTLDVPEAMRQQIRKKGFPLYSRQENLGTLMRNA